jgi:hypothetical protein
MCRHSLNPVFNQIVGFRLEFNFLSLELHIKSSQRSCPLTLKSTTNMPDITLPLSFQNALRDSLSYPQNTILRTVETSDKSIEFIKARLDGIAEDLFEKAEKEWEIPIRDLDTADGKGEPDSCLNNCYINTDVH